MARSLALVVLALSLSLAGCASTGLVAPGAPGGGSGGSPLAGSPDYGAATEHVATASSRDLTPSHESSRDPLSARREPQIHGHIMCRNCR